MKTNKKFDCVKMKNDIQKTLKRQFECNKGKYGSYYDFIIKKANNVPIKKKMF